MTGTKNISGYKKRWYREWFGEEYLSVYAHRNLSDAKKLIDLLITELPLQKNDLVLDVGCGNARHGKILARKGFHVIGIDLSNVLLKSALVQNRKNFPFLVEADMRNLPFRSQFDTVLSLFTSYGYFLSDDMNQKVLEEFNFALKDNGKIFFDYLNPDYVATNLDPFTEKTSGKLLIQESRWIDANRVYKKIIIDNSKEFQESVRLYTLNDLSQMFDKAGLNILRVFGDYEGNEYSKDSERMIIKAVK